MNEWKFIEATAIEGSCLRTSQDLVGCIWERNIEAFPVLFLNDSCVVWATRDFKKQIASCLECLDIWIGNPAQLPKLRFGCVYNWNPRWKHLSCLLFFIFSDKFSQHLQFAAFKTKSNYSIMIIMCESCSHVPFHSSWFAIKTGESYWTPSTVLSLKCRWYIEYDHIKQLESKRTTRKAMRSAWHPAIHIVISFRHVVYIMCGVWFRVIYLIFIQFIHVIIIIFFSIIFMYAVGSF